MKVLAAAVVTVATLGMTALVPAPVRAAVPAAKGPSPSVLIEARTSSGAWRVVAADGTNGNTVTTAPPAGVVSHSATRTANLVPGGIAVRDLDGSNARTYAVGSVAQMMWSADDTRIFFAQNGAERQLTLVSGAVRTLAGRLPTDSTVSPDATFDAYLVPGTAVPDGKGKDGRPIYAYPPSRLVIEELRTGRSVERIKLPSDLGLAGDISNDYLQWSPDGARILLAQQTLDRSFFAYDQRESVFTVATGARTDAPWAAYGDEWSPDGSTLCTLSEGPVLQSDGSIGNNVAVSAACTGNTFGKRVVAFDDESFPTGTTEPNPNDPPAPVFLPEVVPDVAPAAPVLGRLSTGPGTVTGTVHGGATAGWLVVLKQGTKPPTGATGGTITANTLTGQISVTGLKPGTSYGVSVFARGLDGTLSAPATTVVRTPAKPGSTTKLTVHRRTATATVLRADTGRAVAGRAVTFVGVDARGRGYALGIVRTAGNGTATVSIPLNHGITTVNVTTASDDHLGASTNSYVL